MKQKIHTPCHTEPSLRVAKPFGKLKTGFEKSSTHFQISKLVNFQILFLFFLCSFFSYGQEYQWQWAKSGGGEMGNTAFTFYKTSDEHIIDIAIDSNNNYYYLSHLNGNSPMYNDNELPENIALEHYGSKDILLLSTDEGGNYRWHQVIGGRLQDSAYGIVVDSENGVYINATLLTTAIEGDNNNYTHLSSDVTLPKVPENWDYTIPHPAFRVGYLLKYSQVDGSLLGYKNYQDETLYQSFTLSRLWIDSNDIIHTYVCLAAGTHLEEMVTVEEGSLETYLVQFDTSLNIVGSPRLFPLIGTNHDYNFFAYNEELNTYYIGGQNEGTQNFSYNDVEIEGKLFILAINGETLEEEWRRSCGSGGDEHMSDIVIDNLHNIYLSGMYYNPTGSTDSNYFGDYELPDNIGGVKGKVPFVIKLNSGGEVQWIRVPDAYGDSTVHHGTIGNHAVSIVNEEVITVPNGRALIWGDYELISEEGYTTIPALLRLNPETGEVLGATYIDNFGAFTKVVGDQNGDLVLGGYFFGQMFSDNEGLPTLQSANNYTDFFMTKLVLDTDSSTDNFLQANIKVYPNPTTDIVYFETEDPLKNYTVYNQNAQQVKVKTQINDTNYQMSFEGLPSGTYFVLIKTESGRNITTKIVKE